MGNLFYFYFYICIARIPYRLLPTAHPGRVHRWCGLVPGHHWTRNLLKDDHRADLLTRDPPVLVPEPPRLCPVVHRVCTGLVAETATAKDQAPVLGPSLLYGGPGSFLFDRVDCWVQVGHAQSHRMGVPYAGGRCTGLAVLLVLW